jgi:hypothetical protein
MLKDECYELFLGMIGMKSSLRTLPIVCVTLESVPYYPAEFKYSLRLNYSVDAAIDVC